MVIQCPSCKKQYNVDSEKITENGVKITCPSCKHQFIARRKADDIPVKKPKKPEPPAVKTPPCEVCGAPSTHVLRGPPPKPLCEQHYGIEKEKESRFFDADTVYDSKEANLEVKLDPSQDPGATRYDPSGDPLQKTQLGQAPAGAVTPRAKPKKAAIQPPDAEPAFESFDDGFDFFDEASPGAGEGSREPTFDSEDFGAGTTKPPVPKPPAAQPGPPTQDPGTTRAAASVSDDSFEQEFNFSSPSESRAAVSQPPSDDPFSPAAMESPTPSAAPTTAAPDEDPFKPAANDATRSSVDYDPFSDEAMNGQGQETEAAPQSAVTEDSFAEQLKAATNLDGSPIDERYSDYDETEESFAWGVHDETKPRLHGDSSLDKEFGGATPQLKNEATPVAAPKKIALKKTAVKPRKPQSMATVALVLLLLLTGMGGSAFLSVTNIIEDPGVADEVKFEEPSFHGRIDATLDSNYLTPSPSAVPKLVIEDEDERAEKIDAAKTHAERAWDLTLRDTRSSYNEALTDVKKAIEYDPQKAELTSLKISILALRETINDRGETSFKSSDSGRELKNAGQDLLRKTVMQRARAHVLVNSGKSEAAKSLAEEYYREHQTDALACYVLAMTYRHQKKPDLKKTVKYLEEAIKHERGFIRARWELAAAYRDQNRYDDARRTYTAILKMAPDRKGTAEAMERLAERDVAKTKKPIAKGPDKGRPKPVTKPKTPVKAEPEGIRGTGSSLSDSVVGSIKSVDRYMKRYKPKGGKSSNGRPTRPRPPEEGPKPRPPEEGP